jgi:hypothetical protein
MLAQSCVKLVISTVKAIKNPVKKAESLKFVVCGL